MSLCSQGLPVLSAGLACVAGHISHLQPIATGMLIYAGGVKEQAIDSHHKRPAPAASQPKKAVCSQPRCAAAAGAGSLKLSVSFRYINAISPHCASQQCSLSGNIGADSPTRHAAASSQQICRRPQDCAGRAHLLWSFRQHSGLTLKVYRSRKSSKGSVPAVLLAYSEGLSSLRPFARCCAI